MADDIVLNIVLNGLDDIIAQLQQAGQAGSTAFDALAEAAAKISGNVDEAGASIGKTAETSHAAEINIAALGETGTRAFTNLASTSERFVGSLNQLSVAGAIGAFEQLGSAVEGVSAKLGPLGEGFAVLTGVFAGVAAGIGGVTLGLYEFAKSGAEATVRGEELATAAGGADVAIGGLKAAFAAAGASTENFQGQLKILSISISSVWPEIRKEVRDSATSIEEAQIKIREASVGVATAQDQSVSAFIKTREAALSVADAQRKVESSGNAVKSAQFNLVDAQDKIRNSYLARQQAALSVEQAEYNLRLAQGGGRDKDVEDALKLEAAELAVKKAKEQQREAAKAVERDALAEKVAQEQLQAAYASQEKDALTLQKTKLDLAAAERDQGLQADKQATARLELQKAQNEAADNQLKDIPTISAALAGQTDLFKGIQGQANLAAVSTDTLFKTIVEDAGKAKAAAEGLTGSIKPNDFEVLLQVAKAFQTITDQAERQAIARRALGRSVSEAEIEALAKGPALYQQWIESEKQAGYQTATLREGARQFVSQLGTLNSHLDIIRQQMAAPFTAIFTEQLTTLNQVITQNRERIVTWATDLASKVKPIIEDVFKLIEGKDIDPAGFVGKLVQGFKAFLLALTAIKDALVDIARAITPIAGAIVSITDATVGFDNAIQILTGLALGSWLLGSIEKLGKLAEGFKAAETAASEFKAARPSGATVPEAPAPRAPTSAPEAGPTVEPFRLPRPSGPTEPIRPPVPETPASPPVETGASLFGVGEAGALTASVRSLISGGIIGAIVFELGKLGIDKLVPKPEGKSEAEQAHLDEIQSPLGVFHVLRDLQQQLGLGTPTTTTTPNPNQRDTAFPGAALNKLDAALAKTGDAAALINPKFKEVADAADDLADTLRKAAAAQVAHSQAEAKDAAAVEAQATNQPLKSVTIGRGASGVDTGKPGETTIDPVSGVKVTRGPAQQPLGFEEGATRSGHGLGPVFGSAQATPSTPVPVEVVGTTPPPTAATAPAPATPGAPATPPASVTQPLPVEIVGPSPGSVPGPPRGIGAAPIAPALPPSAATPVPVEIVGPPAGPIPTAPATTGPANVLPPSVGTEAAGGIVPAPAAAEAATGANDLSSAFDKAAAAVSAFASSLNPITQAKAGEGGNDQGSQKLDEAGQKLDQAGGQLSTAVDGLNNAGTTLSDAAQAMDQAASAVSDAASRLSTPGHAGGGFVSGPGTTTSDSIPARLSHGEYVVQARAVQHYGVNTMHAINQMHAPAMAIGGYIDALTAPSFKAGGTVKHDLLKTIETINQQHVQATTFGQLPGVTKAPGVQLKAGGLIEWLANPRSIPGFKAGGSVQHDLLKTMDVINQQHERATVFGQLAGVPKAPGVQLAEGGLVEGFATGGAVHHKKHGGTGQTGSQPFFALPALSPHAQRESLIFQTLFAPHAMPPIVPSVPAKIPGHKAGGLVEWLSAIPAFKAGGLVEGNNMIGGGFETMPGFATGGRVDHVSQQHLTKTSAGASGPYASAGGSGGQRALTLVIEGKQFPGLSGPANVVGDMERHATGSRLSRISRNNPSWRK